MAARPSYSNENPESPAQTFEGLVREHHPALYRFALSLSHTESDAEDLVQETFLTWAEKGRQLKDAAKAKSWLFTTLHRHFLEKQRRQTRFPHFAIEELSSELPHLDPEILATLDGRALIQLLGRLDPQFQGAVALFYLEDYSYNEISEVLEIPLGTVKSRIARGLAQLRTLLNDVRPFGRKKEELP